MFGTKIHRGFLAPILALAWLFALLPCGQASAQTITDTFFCGHQSTVDLGPMLAGGTLQDSLLLTTIDTVADSVRFSLVPHGNISLSDSSQQPILRAGKSTYVATIRYSRNTLGADNDSIVLESLSGNGCHATYHIIARTVGPDSNNSIISLKNSSHEVIAFKSDTTNETLQIQFNNDLGSSIFIDSLTLKKDSAFRINFSSVTFPATIPAGGSFKLTLSFIANTPGFYTDYLRSPDQPILPFSIQGLLLPNQGVQMQPGITTYVSLYPNPSHSMVTIHTDGLSQATVTITDVLGRVLSKSALTNEWTWNGETGAGVAPTGTYFVIVTGRDASGKTVHEVHRIVLE